MKIKHLYLIILVALFAIGGCHTSKTIIQSNPEVPSEISQRYFLDSILQVGLDHEALFTLLGDLKPMSSLISFSFPIANTDSTTKTNGNILNRLNHGAYLDSLYQIQKAINNLNIPDLRFVMSSFRAPYDEIRTIQVNVIRISALDSLLKAKESFFGQFGLVPGTDPGIVVNTIEYNDRYERLRGYGYLFGYPDYAIDFFVNAFLESDTTKKHVERNFFQIPTYAGKEGNFVYAYPKDQTPTATVDSVIYYKAQRILEKYKTMRKDYLNPDSTLQSYKLLQQYIQRAK